MAGDSAPTAPPPLVAALSAAWQDAHANNTATSRAAFDEQLTHWLEAFEAEHAGVIRGVMEKVLQSGALHPAVAEVIGSLANPVHQTQVILGLFSVGAIVREFVSAVIAPYVQDAANVSWSDDPTAPLSPSEMAIGVLKGHVDPGTAATEAQRSGIDSSRFQIMVDNTGEPPGLEQLMMAYRRGYIDQGTFEKGVRQSRVRDEWTETLLRLRYQPVAPGEVLSAAVQGHLSQSDGADRLQQAGIDPDNWTWLYETHGRPPGTMEMLHLLNRGEITEAEVTQAIRESDVKNKYIPALLKLRRQLMPQRTVVSGISKGVISPDEGVHKLMMIGYDADDARILASEATATKHVKVKELTESQVLTLYTEAFLTHDEATSMLRNLGYDDNEVRLLTSLADHARHQRFQQSAITAVHTQFVAHHIDAARARTTLDSIGVPAAARDDLLQLWNDERAAHVAHLTRADLANAHKKGLINVAEWERRLAAMGYAEDDIHIIVGLSAK